ncbi:MAG: preprotein translocase subunit YajC [Alphaproteobacteria bacterium]|nr:preprotein translocase subunit YajC [Alphaproteobacteria bacterium]
MFISEAFAAAETANQAGGLSATLVQLALILLIFYFFLIRPQQKKIREHSEMVNALKVGDKVLTSGGIHGKVSKIDGNEISLEVADKVNIVIDRMSISGVFNDKKSVEKADKKVSAKKSQK